MLSNIDITSQVTGGKIKITPFNKDLLNSNSYDLTLGKVLYEIVGTYVDLSCPPPLEDETFYKKLEIEEEGYVLKANGLYLGVTQQKIQISQEYGAIVYGKSSASKLFLSVHQTGGFGDAGFNGYWTLSLSPRIDTRVYEGQKIAQVAFYRLISRSSKSYKPEHEKSCHNLQEPNVSCGCSIKK